MTSGLAVVRADFARLDPGWMEESDSATFKAFFPGLPCQARNRNGLPYTLQWLANQNIATQIGRNLKLSSCVNLDLNLSLTAVTGAILLVEIGA